MKRRKSLAFLFLGFLLTTCIKPYTPEINEYEKTIIIDGLLTDDGNPPTVMISYSTNVSNSYREKVSGANVHIISSNGEKFKLEEDKKSLGTYSYFAPMFPVKIGESFQLVVEFEGNEYRSSMDKVMSVCPIAEVGFQANYKQKTVDLLLSTTESANDSKFYAWRLSETWKFRSPVNSYKTGKNDLCYINPPSSGIYVGSTETFKHSGFTKFNFFQIPTNTGKVAERYSVFIEQFSISRETYKYLDHIKKTNESGGTLFDPIPSSMNGNIRCETAKVIGNFQVSSVKSRRIYIDRSDLPKDLPILSGTEDCGPYNVDASPESKPTRDSLLRERKIVMDTVTMEQQRFVRFVSGVSCYDCTATGSPNTPPTWWEEKK